MIVFKFHYDVCMLINKLWPDTLWLLIWLMHHQQPIQLQGIQAWRMYSSVLHHWLLGSELTCCSSYLPVVSCPRETLKVCLIGTTHTHTHTYRLYSPKSQGLLESLGMPARGYTLETITSCINCFVNQLWHCMHGPSCMWGTFKHTRVCQHCKFLEHSHACKQVN